MEGVPPKFTTRRSWAATGLQRERWGAFTGLLLTWTGVIVVLWAASFGAVLAMLVATRVLAPTAFTQSLFHAENAPTVDVWHTVGAALGGAGGGLSAATARIVGGDGGYLLGLSVLGAVVAATVVVVTVTFEGDLLVLRRCRRPSLDELRRISPLLQRIEEAAELERMPRVAMVDAKAPSAWVHIRHVVMTTGLLDRLDDDELTAVLAHRIHNWQVGDAMASTVVWACAWPLAVLYNIGWGASGHDLEGPSGDWSGVSVISVVTWLVLWPVWVAVRMVIVPVVAPRVRRHEYEADEATKGLGFGAGLSSALRRSEGARRARTGWEAAMYSTLPAVELRIERLQPTRALTAFFKAPELGRVSPVGASRRTLVGAAAIVVVLGVGVAVNDQAAHFDQAAAQTSAARFVTAYLDAGFSQPAYDRVITDDGVPGSVASMKTSAAASPLGVEAMLAAGYRTTSRASSALCRSSAVGPAQSVAVHVDWTTSVDGAVRRQLVTASVRLLPVAGQWRPVDVPVLTAERYVGEVSNAPSGFGRCA